MKIKRIFFWTSTATFSLWMLGNAFAYLTSDQAKILCKHFGFPDYFRVELASAKILGVIVLLFPVFEGRLKEWVYSGFTITIISGFIAHIYSGDSFKSSAAALLALVILIISYYTYQHLKLKKNESSSNF